jgi:hypothetical protein
MFQNNDTDLVFPHRLIPVLLNHRGPTWQSLVAETTRLNATDPRSCAFVLLIARLANCTTCHVDTIRALHGCAQCARQSVMRFRGSDQDLITLYAKACEDIDQYVNSVH